MLQPREPNRISDSRFKKISSLPSRINMICFIYHNQNWSLALLTALILTIVHIDASQAINQPFLVSPTPTLQAIAADEPPGLTALASKTTPKMSVRRSKRQKARMPPGPKK
ncbi:uncharacterized protein [Drosophila suzukii]|uniref:Uncharacterized protein isoform X2 n=1 Tax=Drosophila suzukii TaxID=28584 RepID=A0AB40DMA8_DROSZ